MTFSLEKYIIKSETIRFKYQEGVFDHDCILESGETINYH